jgi:FixJ family two-component response regulator
MEPNGELTQRERQVIVMAAMGLTSEQSATVLGSTKYAVEKVREAAKQKLGARRLSHLVYLASQQPPLLDAESLTWLRERINAVLGP